MSCLVSLVRVHWQERGWDNIGVMESDWKDVGPDAGREHLEIYNVCNGWIFTLKWTLVLTI